MELRICQGSTVVMAAILCLRLLILSATGAPLPPQLHYSPASRSAPEAPGAMEQVPKLLLDIYKCWASGSKGCLPTTDPEVNLVRSLFGQFKVGPQAQAALKYQNRELTSDVAITFNSSIFSQDSVHEAALQVHRKALSQEEINSLTELECDLSDLKILLFSTQPQEDEDKDVVVLESDMPLSADSLSKEEWLSFTNVTRILANRASNSFLKLQLAMVGSCSNATSSMFGISESQSGYHPELVIYAKGESEDSFGSVLKDLQRKKRQAAETVSTAENSTEATSLESRKPSTIAEYKAAKCQIHDFNVSFAELGWNGHVIEPQSFNARFCAGRCDWPLDMSHNYTKHSYIQALLNAENPDRIPAPCCAPQPSTMGRLAVVVRHSNDSFSMQWWDNMIARACACL